MPNEMKISLCLNCLETGGVFREMGPQQGPQMDPYRKAISLCAVCWEALYSGDMGAFAGRFRGERTVTR